MGWSSLLPTLHPSKAAPSPLSKNFSQKRGVVILHSEIFLPLPAIYHGQTGDRHYPPHGTTFPLSRSTVHSSLSGPIMWGSKAEHDQQQRKMKDTLI